MYVPLRGLRAITAAALIAYGASASAYLMNDLYHGGADHGYGDRIGGPVFEVQGADYLRTGTSLTVDIYTSLAGHADEFLFSAYTNKAASKIAGTSMGIGYGDLFLASTWAPFGAAPYTLDNHSNSTLWSYAFSIDGNRWTDAGGTGTLFLLNGATNDANALLSEDFMSGAIYRNGQEVAVDRSSQNVIAIGTGTWSVVNDSRVSYTFDIGATALLGSSTLALHWAMSCGNDTLEGLGDFPTPPPPPDVGVPEPGTLALAVLGLAGFTRRRMRCVT